MGRSVKAQNISNARQESDITNDREIATPLEDSSSVEQDRPLCLYYFAPMGGFQVRGKEDC
jgi:hypothetical protein